MEYRRVGASQWKTGHDLWVDHRTDRRDSRECRGSLVQLSPGADYEIRLTYTDPDGGSGATELEASTWSDGFSEGEVVEVDNRSSTLHITESGMPDAYRVYQPPAGQTSTIDAADSHDNNIIIDANYVVVRGLNLTGASEHAVVLAEGVHDVVIDHCDISNWGPAGIGSLDDWNWRSASGIYADGATERIVIQYNEIHHPRGGANSWEDGSAPWQDGNHPKGPQAISFDQYGCSPCSGNHVIRYNHCYSEGVEHYFNDVIGGGANGQQGNLYRDSDVYGNVLSHAWDDGLEMEGYNINNRVWGNVFHDTMKAVATANIGISNAWGGIDNSLGPHYIWRNLIMDAIEPYPSATKHKGNGGYFFYNNTIINAGLAVAAPRNDPNTDYTRLKMIGVVKNNIMLPGGFRSNPDSLGDSWKKWDFDYNLYGNDPTFYIDRLGVSGWETNGIFEATPQFDIEGDYIYYLAAGEPGVDVGEVIPNFSDQYSGNGPDMGAFERGVFPPPSDACTDGDTQACGRGVCAGQRACIDGEWSTCSGPSPSDEICDNGLDDDCDGDGDTQDSDCRPADLSAPYTTDGHIVDGELDGYGGSGLEFSAGAVAGNSVAAHALWDDQNLYLGFRIDDDNVEVNSVPRDGDAFLHDSIEVFLDTDRDGGAHMSADDYHFVIDAEGSVWDGRGTDEADNAGDQRWDSSIETATSITEMGYNLEVAIAWDDLEAVPDEGRRLGILVVNNDLDGGDLTYFSQNGGPPWNVPNDWGDLRLTGDGSSDTPDAGPPDASSDTPDAGLLDAGLDAETDAAQYPADNDPARSSGDSAQDGCACQTGRASRSMAWPVYLIVVVMVGRFVSTRRNLS